MNKKGIVQFVWIILAILIILAIILVILKFRQVETSFIKKDSFIACDNSRIDQCKIENGCILATPCPKSLNCIQSVRCYRLEDLDTTCKTYRYSGCPNYCNRECISSSPMLSDCDGINSCIGLTK